MNLPFATEERDKATSSGDQQYRLKYDELFQLILACNFGGLLMEYEGHPFINFLKETGCRNFAMFLEVFIRYKRLDSCL